MNVSIVWFRQDLRLDDNPALYDAAVRGTVLPVFIWSPEEEGRWPPGAASRWWLHRSLQALDAELTGVGSRLIVRRGASLQTLLDLANETGARTVCWNRRYEPAAAARDAVVATGLRAAGIRAESFNGSLLLNPSDIRTKQGGPFQVFTAFWRVASAQLEEVAPDAAPTRLAAPERWPASVEIAALGLEPTIDWAGGLQTTWRPGLATPWKRLDEIVNRLVARYHRDRDVPGIDGTTRLSPHLHFGEVSPRRVWRVVNDARRRDGATAPGAEVLLKEIGWREFAHHLLHHFPHTTDAPLRDAFDRFPWEDDPAGWRAWRGGQTGYPIVDAGMRQLWHTGWMHNRVRMIVASFLTKDLRISWRRGAQWFWDTLVDADLANNTLNWQWAGGCGADAAPYFRIFNPVTQGEKFDPQGRYVRSWVPELIDLPDEWIHHPWDAPEAVLSKANVRLGQNYPEPIIDHAEARQAALAAFVTIRR